MKLVSSQPGSEPDTPLRAPSRYRLYVSDQPGLLAQIRVYDRSLRRVFLKWQGELARRMLDSEALADMHLSNGCHDCDKALVRSLVLAAAKLSLLPASGGRSEDLARRLRHLGRPVPLLTRKVAALLFQHPGHHFEESEIVCALTSDNLICHAGAIQRALDELVQWDVIQRIEVDEINVFYDIDTRPHVHVFDAGTRVLSDVPASGVLKVVGSGL